MHFRIHFEITYRNYWRTMFEHFVTSLSVLFDGS